MIYGKSNFAKYLYLYLYLYFYSFHSFVNIENTHRDCRVRRKRVLDAILWLKDNNPYYKDITLNRTALQQLPEEEDGG